MGPRADPSGCDRARCAAGDVCLDPVRSRRERDAETCLELVLRHCRGEGLQLAFVGFSSRRTQQLRLARLLSRIEEEEPEAARAVGCQPDVMYSPATAAMS